MTHRGPKTELGLEPWPIHSQLIHVPQVGLSLPQGSDLPGTCKKQKPTAKMNSTTNPQGQKVWGQDGPQDSWWRLSPEPEKGPRPKVTQPPSPWRSILSGTFCATEPQGSLFLSTSSGESHNFARQLTPLMHYEKIPSFICLLLCTCCQMASGFFVCIS